jgi:hypothetical protein
MAVYASLLIFWLMSPDQRRLALPTLIIASIAAGALMVLKRREGVFPFFELGTMTIVATAVYALIPLLGYMLSGLTWTILSDNRLYSMDFSPAQMGRFAWWNASYLLSFVIVYLHQRGRFSAQGVPIVETDPLTAVSLVVLTLAIMIYLILMYVVTGATLWHNYADLEAETTALRNLPLLVLQLTLRLFSIYIVAKLGLVILIMRGWPQKRWRYCLFLWIGVETVITLIRMGARTELVFLLLATVLAYHRLVKPLKVSTVMLVGVLMLSGILLYGALRNYVLYYRSDLPMILQVDMRIFSTVSEFQILWGTAADLQDMKMRGNLGEIPKAVYFYDFVAFIPQQFLPFAKIEPAEWYLEKIKQAGVGQGFMFGVMSQGVIGGGWLEMILRGTILGYIFAALHRWYVRRAGNFYVTLFYLVMCMMSYYTYRASTFYFLFIIVYQVIPCVLLIKLGRIFLSSGRKALMTERG